MQTSSTHRRFTSRVYFGRTRNRTGFLTTTNGITVDVSHKDIAVTTTYEPTFACERCKATGPPIYVGENMTTTTIGKSDTRLSIPHGRRSLDTRKILYLLIILYIANTNFVFLTDTRSGGSSTSGFATYFTDTFTSPLLNIDSTREGPHRSDETTYRTHVS